MNFAILLCGGTGSRMGNEFKVPKQYIKVKKLYIFAYSLQIIENHSSIDKIIICADKSWHKEIEDTINHLGLKKEVLFSEPGETRQMSVYNSMKVAQKLSFDSNDIVVIHDGARPMINDGILEDCIEKCKINDGAIATISVTDTIYQSKNGDYITNVPKRSSLRAGQTPEAFNLQKYLDVHKKNTISTINSVTGGAEFAANNGMKIVFSKGSLNNLKITTREDLDTFKEMIK